MDLNDPRRDQYWAVKCHTSNCDGTKAWSVAKTLVDVYLHQLASVGTVDLTPRASVDPGNVREMVNLHLPELAASGVRTGDVLYLPDANPPHVGMVVGWGPVIVDRNSPELTDGTLPALNDVYPGGDMVPYVIDHGLHPGIGAIPYYAQRWNIGETGFAAGNMWRFVKIPDEVCVGAEDFIP